jgi:SAM-dependent methyltransferase
VSEFTGERVIPGQVNEDLWAEHVARYALATRFASGRKVLDVGCGTGYGTAELECAALSAIGIDIAPEATAYARRRFPRPTFFQASATSLPFKPCSFDLVTAFEVIEHLADWPTLLSEARRVLEPIGLFLVSTPNKRYYAEARAKSGPNPFHEHEFEYEEFAEALREHFPHIRILLQDRVEAFAFHDAGSGGKAEAHIARETNDPQSATFFIGICSPSPLPPIRALLYVPKAANLLREREQHISLLETELAQVRAWLDQTTADRNELLNAHTDLQKQFQDEQTRAAKLIEDLNEENRRKTQWAIETEQRLTADLEKRAAQLAETVRLLDRAEATVVERTEWARKLDAQLQETAKQLALIGQSRWLKLGRQFGLGPRIKEASE